MHCRSRPDPDKWIVIASPDGSRDEAISRCHEIASLAITVKDTKFEVAPCPTNREYRSRDRLDPDGENIYIVGVAPTPTSRDD